MRKAVPAIAALFVLMLAGSVAPAYSATIGYENLNDFGHFGISEAGRMAHPDSVAQDSEGSLYVTDLGNKRVQKFHPNGTYVDQWGRSGTANSEFHEPSGIAIDGQRVYVSDRDLHRIQVFDLEGNYLSEWGQQGADGGEFFFPTDIVIGANGTLYVADAGNQRIQAFDQNGTYLHEFGQAGTGEGQFLHLAGLSTDGDGSIYASDKGNGKIYKFDAHGNYTATIHFKASNWLFAPVATAVAPDGSIFILNSGDSRVLHLEQDGHEVLRTLERLGPFGNYLHMGSDLLLAASGHLYVVDSLGHKVYEFNTPYEGKMIPEPEEAPAADPAASNQTLSEPAAPSAVEVTGTEATAGEQEPAGTVGCGLPMSEYNVIMGTENNDLLEGTPGSDLIFGLGGDDIISAQGGNDCIYAGEGDDIVFGNGGNDGIFGDQGNDTLKGSEGNDIIYGNYGLDSIDGGEGTDTCMAADPEGQDVITNCEG